MTRSGAFTGLFGVLACIAGTEPAAAQIAIAGTWYLRGDIGWSGSTNANVHDRNGDLTVNPLIVNPPPAAITGITGTLSGIGSALAAGVGVGAQFTSSIRGDIVYTYRGNYGLNDTDDAVPPRTFSADISSNSVMATAYWDFPIENSVVAYGGFGLGWANVKMSNISSDHFLVAVPHIVGATGIPFAPDGNTDNFAWQLTAGVAFPIGNGALVDIFYRYFDAGHVQTAAGDITVDGTRVGGYGGAEGALHAHELGLSIRFSVGS
jgi:opacity protein-like surface antigen